ncbi:GNAT family N-acetyltransferase [Virgibacillus sp. W0430]|uniref:GNAT family N-acetyltransferase n=1 Tax=Virgibacillus sp. W0430 TaxID=3391580 RepID=UPI003F45F6D0
MRSCLQSGNLQSGQAYKIAYLSIDDLPKMLVLQEKVIESIEQKDSLQPLTVQEFTTIFSGKGFVIGVFIDEKLIALRAMLEPKIDEEHFGLDAGLPDEDLEKVIYQEISCVDPAYRGNRLQQMMGRIVMNELDRDRFRYVSATVAPFNIPSLKDKLALGLEIVALKEKYEGKLRYVFMKDLNLNKRLYKNEVYIEMGKITEQKQLLQSGYLGVGIREIEGKWFVQYAQPTNSKDSC